MCGGEREVPRALGRTDGAAGAATRGSRMGGALQPLPVPEDYRMEVDPHTVSVPECICISLQKCEHL